MESGYQRQLIYTVNDLSILYNSDPLLKKEKSFPGGSEGKASACNAGDPGLIPGLGRSPGEGNTNQSSILAWKIPWTEEPGRLQPPGLQSQT